MYISKNGESLKQFCKNNKVPYSPMWDRVAVKNMTPEEALKHYKNRKNRPPSCCRWFYKGESLQQYCKKNGLPYQRILNSYWNFNKNNKVRVRKLTIEEVVEMFEKDENPKRLHHFYHGKTIKEVCAEYNIDYRKIFNAYHNRNMNKNRKPYTMEEIIDSFLTNKK